VLSVIVQLPFASGPWALPILFRLFRTNADCERNAGVHRSKPVLAREMVDCVARWLRKYPIEVTADQAYACKNTIRDLPSNVEWIGAMRLDAALTAAPTGRRKKGDRLPSPQELAMDPNVPWTRTRVMLYGRTQTVEYKTCQAQWYHVVGSAMVRIVVVRCGTDDRPLRAFFCTRANRTVPSILQTYS
jgi:hypothetical protein